MPRAPARTVLVLDAQGRPAAGVFVAVVAGTAPTPEIALTTDTTGQARLGLPDGRFRIEARARDGRRALVEVAVAGTAASLETETAAGDILIRLPPLPS